MNIRSIAGVVYCCSAAALSGAPSDDTAKAYETKAHAALSEAPAAVTHAQMAGDLDGILKELQGLQNSPGNAPEAANKVATTFQFITQWQDYLAAADAKNWPEAQNALRQILNNRQLDAPSFFPRSEILERYEETFHGGVKIPTAPSPSTAIDPDTIFDKIQNVDEIDQLFPKLLEIAPKPGMAPWDWTELMVLDKARGDLLAGITVQVDLNKAMNPPTWGDNISRITAMELLVILPRYLNTEITAPPKQKETLNDYLGRIATNADHDGNLALLQRVVAVQTALGTARDGGPASGTQRFLAGLSQDAAGQYIPAVISYENALKEPDRFLPVEIVGARLAAIKAAHPDDFDTGMTDFLTPPLDLKALQAMMPGRMQGMPWQPFPQGRPLEINVLPIPMTISVSARVTPTAPATK